MMSPAGYSAGPGAHLSRAEVREVDRRAIQELGVPGVVLMENAGLGLTAIVLRELVAQRVLDPISIVCGTGNNGGDGLVLARHLALAGRCATVLYCGDRARADRASEGGINLTIIERAGIALEETRDGPALEAALARLAPGLVVDALYGTGLAGPLREPGLSLVRALDGCGRPVIAVDIPSGLDCDTGRPLGAAVRAVRTVTFVAEKVGFAAPGARAFTGEVEVVSIGCPPQAWEPITPPGSS